MEITFPAQYALDVAPFISKEPVRYYLCGFLIEGAGEQGLQITAADGARLGTFMVSEGRWMDGSGPVENRALYSESIILGLPKEVLAACKSKAREGARWLRVEPGPTDRQWLVTVCIPGEGDEPVDRVIMQAPVNKILGSNYPDFRRVVPAETMLDRAPKDTGKRAGYTFNPAHLGDFKHLGKGITVWPDGTGNDGPAIVTVADRADFFGVLMPMRPMNHVPDRTPGWVTDSPALKPATAQAAE